MRLPPDRAGRPGPWCVVQDILDRVTSRNWTATPSSKLQRNRFLPRTLNCTGGCRSAALLGGQDSIVSVGIAGRLCDVVPELPGWGAQMRDVTWSRGRVTRVALIYRGHDNRAETAAREDVGDKVLRSKRAVCGNRCDHRRCRRAAAVLRKPLQRDGLWNGTKVPDRDVRAKERSIRAGGAARRGMSTCVAAASGCTTALVAGSLAVARTASMKLRNDHHLLV